MYVCPRCDYALVPVLAHEGSKRRVIALACPEPYCDHIQMVPKELEGSFLKPRASAELGRMAN
jgi:hypothetical protein